MSELGLCTYPKETQSGARGGYCGAYPHDPAFMSVAATTKGFSLLYDLYHRDECTEITAGLLSPNICLTFHACISVYISWR